MIHSCIMDYELLAIVAMHVDYGKYGHLCTSPMVCSCYTLRLFQGGGAR